MSRLLILTISSLLFYACGDRNSQEYKSTQKTEYYFDKNGKQGVKRTDYFVILKTDDSGQETELMHGPSMKYYESGVLEQEANYRYGKLEGQTKTYYENGGVAEVSNWKNDQYHGIYKYYYENGTAQQELMYSNNMLNGLCKTYYENGTLKKEIIYKNDLLWELTASYDNTGVKLDSLTIVNGKGELREYHSNGQIAVKTNILNGLYDGYFQEFDENGKLRMKTSYQDGKKQGDLKTYHDNGKIAQHSKFDKDINVGQEKYYNDKGVLILESEYKYPPFNKTDSIQLNLGEYKSQTGLIALLSPFNPKGMANGIRNGAHKSYYDNGKLKSEEYYLDNIQDSVSKKYYENGRLKMKEYIDENYLHMRRYIIKYDVDGTLFDSTTYEKKDWSKGKDPEFSDLLN